METSPAEFFLRQVTVYAAIRVVGSPMAATAAQGLATLAMILLVWRAWRGEGPLDGPIGPLRRPSPESTDDPPREEVVGAQATDRVARQQDHGHGAHESEP